MATNFVLLQWYISISLNVYTQWCAELPTDHNKHTAAQITTENIKKIEITASCI